MASATTLDDLNKYMVAAAATIERWPLMEWRGREVSAHQHVVRFVSVTSYQLVFLRSFFESTASTAER